MVLVLLWVVSRITIWSNCSELGAVTIKEAIARAGLQPTDVEEVIMGCVLPAGLKQGPARQAMRKSWFT